MVFALAHLPLGLAMASSSSVAALHGALTFTAVMGCTLFVQRLSLSIYGIAYLAMGGVLWRMTGAGLPWELSKYGLAAGSCILMVRHVRRLPRSTVIIYFTLLIPGAMITIFEKGLGGGRGQVIFNLLGPLSLACAVGLFSFIRMRAVEFRRLVYFSIAPPVAVFAIALQSVINAEEFTASSSKATSGGFGPNQVSTILGLGALLAFLWAMRDRSPLHRPVLFVLSVALIVQSTLTFSRGGLYNVVAALVCVAILYVGRPSRLVAAVVALGLLILVSGSFVEQLDQYTGGALAERFSDTDVTGRDDIASADIDVWLQEPITGVGAGQTKNYRDAGSAFYSNAAAHTEFTRLLSEHGILGLLALAMLGLIALQNMGGRTEFWEQAWVVALLVWTAASMTNAAMRTAAVSYAFALSSVRLVPSPRLVVPSPARSSRRAPATPVS